jgi:hypothetical protein
VNEASATDSPREVAVTLPQDHYRALRNRRFKIGLREAPAAVGDELKAKILTPSGVPQMLLDGGLLRGGQVTVLVGSL